MCSDLDEDEKDEGEEEEKELDDDKEPQSDSDNPFSDNEDDLQTLSRPLRKSRVLDSDDEGNVSPKTHRYPSKTIHIPPPSMNGDTCSMSIFGEETRDSISRPKTVASKPKFNGRRSNVLAEEASMPPLFLNESFESESSESQNHPEQVSQVTTKREDSLHDTEDSNSVNQDMDLPSRGAKDYGLSTSKKAQVDSGVGVSVGMEETLRTQLIERDGNSLESSFQWGQVLPPAQPRRDNSLELLSSDKRAERKQVSYMYIMK